MIKSKKNHAIAKSIKIIEVSDLSVIPYDKYFKSSGGCSISRMKYEHQLVEKTKYLADCLRRIGGFDVPTISPIVGMSYPFNYRNKCIYPCGLNGKSIDFGYYMPKTHRIIFERQSIIENEANPRILDVYAASKSVLT